MIVHGKDGHELELVSNQPLAIGGRNYFVVALKHARYVDGVLTRFIMSDSQQLIGFPIEGEMLEIVEPQTEPIVTDSQIEKEQNNDPSSPIEREVPPADD